MLDGSTTLATVRLNQQAAPNDLVVGGQGWASLGQYMNDSGSLAVRLSDDADGIVVADAVRVVYVAPLVLYWDPDGNPANNVTSTGAGLGGSGTWATGAGDDWYDPLTGQDIAWVNGAQAVFEGAPGIVTISGQVSPGAATFASSDYLLQSGALLLPASQQTTIEVDSGTTVIGSAIVGDGSLAKAGSGALDLAGASSYTGSTTVETGTLRMGGTPVEIPVAPNPIGDASFETPQLAAAAPLNYQVSPTGTAPWVFSGGALAGNGSAYGNPDAPDGTQVAVLQFQSTISQSVVFPVDGTYQISFDAAYRNAQDGANDVKVQVDGADVISAFYPADCNSWDASTTNPFTVSAGAHTITFVGLDTLGGDRSSFVDAVTLLEIPPAISGSPSLPSQSAVTVDSGASLDLNGYAQTVGSLSGGGAVLLGSATLTAGGDGSSTTFSGSLDSPTTPTTGYTYVWGLNAADQETAQPQQVTTTEPVVYNGQPVGGINTPDQNGTGVAARAVDLYDAEGNLVWSEDGNGSLTYDQYDPITGLLTEEIEDADVRCSSTDGSQPEITGQYSAADWSLLCAAGLEAPSASGKTYLNLVTNYYYDNQQRLDETLGPVHTALTPGTSGLTPASVRTASWTVYDDADHTTYSAQGYFDVTLQTFALVNPVDVTVTNPDGQVTDDIQATLGSSGSSVGWAESSSPTSTEVDLGSQSPLALLATIGAPPQSSYTAWTTYQYSHKQLVSTRVYFNIPSTSGGGTQGVPGGEGTNYNLTQYGYDADGRQVSTTAPNGTIAWNVLDAQGLTTSTWVGTNAAPLVSGQPWSPANNGGNMVEISADVYDNGGNGDGNLTETVDFPVGSSSSADTLRVTQMLYDWQDRLVATKSGALVTEDEETSLGPDQTGFQVDGLPGTWLVFDPSEGEDETVQRPITYDVMDNLGQVTAAYVFSGNGKSAGDIANYTIDEAPSPTSSTANLLRSYSTTSYDGLGQVYQTAQYSVDQGGATPGAIGATPETTNNYYDLDGNLTATTDPRGYTTTYGYDGLGQQTTFTEPMVSVFNTATGQTSSVTPTTVTTYDAAGEVVAVQDPNGDVTTYSYDGIGRQVAVTQPDPANGANSDSDHGPVTSYVYNAAGQLASVTDPVTTTTYTYDAAGQQLTVSEPDPDDNSAPLVTSYAYDADGNVASVTDPNGNETDYTYDLLDQPSTVAQPEVNGSRPLTQYVHDNLGELLGTTDPMGRQTTYQYNVLGEQTLETDPSPRDSQPTPYTATTYDALGNVLTTADALGDTTANAYDGFGRLASTTDPDGHVTSYTYDADGNMLSETDPDGNVTTYAYDALGRQTSMADPLGNVARYAYDADGNLVQSIDRDGQEIDYTYDHLDRGTAELWISGSTAFRTIATDYNAQGEVASVTDTGDTRDASPQYVDYAYTYDSIGRLATVTSTGPTGTATVVLTAGYDRDGNRTSLSAAIEAPGASSFTPDFQNTYSYDALNEMLEVAQSAQSGGNAVAAKSAAFGYDSDGELTAVSRFQDAAPHTAVATDTTDLVARAAYGYDGDGRLTSLTYSLPTGSTSTAPAYVWAYDAADRISEQSSRADTDPADPNYNPSDPTTWARAQYNYDPAGQLTTSTVNGTTTHAVTYSANWQNAPNGGTEDYNYDANGNRDNAGFTVSAPSSSTGDNQISSDGTYNYYYDADGNLTRQVSIAGGSETDYSYDFRNRLTEVASKDSSGRVTQVVDYVYDAFNRLVGRTQANYTYTGDSTTPSSTVTATGHFVYDGDNMVLALDNSGNVTDRVLWGPAVDQVLAEEDSSGTVTWALSDNQGTVRDLAQYSGGTTTVVNHRVFSSFGQLLSQTNPSTGTPATVDSVFGYTGSYYDSATGLQWNLNRWYNPSLQRWMGQDPDGLLPDANPYRYCGDGPMDGVDATGLARDREGTCCWPPTLSGSSNAYDIRLVTVVYGPPGQCRPSSVQGMFDALGSVQQLEMLMTVFAVGEAGLKAESGKRIVEMAKAYLKDKIEGELSPNPSAEEAAEKLLKSLAEKISEKLGYRVWVRMTWLSCEKVTGLAAWNPWGPCYTLVRHTDEFPVTHTGPNEWVFGSAAVDFRIPTPADIRAGVSAATQQILSDNRVP